MLYNHLMALSPDSKFIKFMSKLVDILFLNLIMLACCIPVITVGAAVTAAYAVILKMVDDEEGYIFKTFFKEFKANFRQGTILWLIVAVLIYGLYLEWQIVTKLDVNFIIIAIVIIATAAVICCLLYSFPLIARYKNTIINTIKNSFKISVYYFGSTLLILAVVALEIFLFMWNKWLMLAGILVGPMIVIYTIAGMSKRIFRKIEQDNPCPPAEPEQKEEGGK